MIAKEQTAKAIANTADAYEKNGVEAALCEVGAEPRKRTPSWLCIIPLDRPLLFPFLCSSVALPRLARSPSAFLCFALVFLTLFLLFLLGRSPRRQSQRRPSREQQPLRFRQSSPGTLGGQSRLPRLAHRSRRWKSPVWGRSPLGPMQTDITRRYRSRCRG